MEKLSKFINFHYLTKWVTLSVIVGILIGTGSALFLIGLDWATNTREGNQWLIWLLPIAGFLIGYTYYKFGYKVVSGNNLLIREVKQPTERVQFRMAPMVVLGTIITHLFGGSAGREGTAVQMGGAIADQFSKPFQLTEEDRKIIIGLGVSGGFAAVFGTPLAGILFAFEILALNQLIKKGLIPIILTAFIADYFCTFVGAGHAHYFVDNVPIISLTNSFWAIVVGIASGLVAMLFSQSSHYFSGWYKNQIKYAPLRPFIGGIVVSLAVYLIGTTKYIGLGIPTIQAAFSENLLPYDFLIKLIFTVFTLSVGFKGGEVTPLFYIGATLGNALFWFVPLPLCLLAGMGFLAVFAGAAKTPLTCILMGFELFGLESVPFIALSSVVAYFVSGKRGIYHS